MSSLVDVHSHLDDKKFSNLDSIIVRARKAGVKIIICNGLNPKSNRVCLELSEKYDIVRASLGIYPSDAERLSSKELEDEIMSIEKNRNRIVAIGEVGLDFHWTKKDETEKIEKQRMVFKKLIKLSEKICKPLIVHSRKAEKECIEILEKSRNRKIVMHCFNGNKKLVEKVINNKWFFSIPANIVRSKQFQMIVEECPINQLLTETDAPYLSPYQGRINEPSFIVETIKKIAEIKNMDETEVINNIFMNYQTVFLQ